MTDLLSQLEAATEGSRALSDEVLLACGWKRQSRMWWSTPLNAMWVETEDRPDPSQDLQDAVSLLPGSLDKSSTWWGVRRGGLTYFEAWIGTPHPPQPGDEGRIQGDTPALALCIAIIKAHESKAEAA